MSSALTLAEAFAQAMSRYESGDRAGAKKLARKIENRAPDFGGVHYLLGLIALADGAFPAAEKRFRRALAITPDQPPLMLGLARALAAQDRSADALAECDRLLRLAPDLPQALAERAMCLDRLGRIDEAILAYRAALARDPAWRAGAQGLGLCLRARKKFSEAAEIFRALAEADPADAAAWANLGVSLKEAGRSGEARPALERALARDPECLAALYHLADIAQDAALFRNCLVLDPEDRLGAGLALARLEGATPAQAPEAHVRELFDEYAESFDAFLVEGLAYRGPALLKETLERMLAPRPASLAILDAGCGTGLVGAALKPFARSLAGVDLAPKMIAKAKERGIYDELAAAELVSFLSGRRNSFDLIVAGDVLVYIGDLAPFLAAAASSLTAGGHLLFTVEKAEAAGFVLGAKGRFAHSPDYLEGAAARAGFSARLIEEASTRTEGGQAVPGLVALFAKN